MNLVRVELMRSYRFGPKNNAIGDFSRFVVGERGCESIVRDELGWVWIVGEGECLMIPPHHVDFARPLAQEISTHAATIDAFEREAATDTSASDRAKRAWETRRRNAAAKEE